MTLEQLNALEPDAARLSLLRCCGATRWADRMASRRPFASREALFALADRLWAQEDRAGKLEAFAAHPRIGDLDGVRRRFAATAAWAEGEQAAVGQAQEEVLRRLAAGNRAYEARFGHLYIVCATGRTAPEILRNLEERLAHEPDAEWDVAAEEQRRITRLRLEKLLEEDGAPRRREGGP